ncbi:thiamine pyrophosphate-dependent enzyme [Comamonas testosteroni]|uniref:thiamine pyrophosphate-dependent enzyme n=1 Tax=Comamonas testosteroni TaxID=285 RepID=UPI001E30AF95|nr:thiamine pyrophosphate-dependent enzyme [Comamonas testosteroni]WEE78186.1 thiamine pyrophosphate-dependent enzyme [Comamonas testosteroni]
MNNHLPTLALGSVMAELIQARAVLEPNAVLVATMSSMLVLDELGETHRRIDSVPLMGGAAGLGLGIALSRPDVPVVVLDGDASLLMELGSLATVARNQPNRYLHVVINNQVQFNGITNLPVVATEPSVDFTAMALAAGYQSAERIDSFAAWKDALPRLLSAKGASFVELCVRPDARRVGAQQPQPILPDIQFVRMRMAARKLMVELA